MRLQGKVALLTGGSRGIGAALSLGLAREGARVVVNYFTSASAAAAVVDEIRASGGDAIKVQADVSRSQEVKRLVDEAANRYGAVDILVNNAAMTEVHKPWLSISEDEWDRVMAVNLKSCFLMSRAVYPLMRQSQWGRIINLSSVTFFTGQANLLHYVASKGGIIGLTRTLARELGPDGITVNAISPGAIQTESELRSFPDQEAVRSYLLGAQAVKRRGVPEDIVGATVLLASDAGAFITGQTVNVDGGWAMH
jgi:3-oxoacyl-[acyl-carrier protein] reductase